MELSGSILLYTMAGLMVTFAGFSALLLAVRQAAGGRLSQIDRYLAKTVLTQLFVLTAGALLPPIIALYGVSEGLIWQISASVFALTMLSLLVSYPYRRRNAIGKGPPPIILAIFVVFGSAVVAVMLIYVLSGFPYGAAAYITALAVNFFTTAFAFVTALDVIMQQPIDASAGNKERLTN